MNQSERKQKKIEYWRSHIEQASRSGLDAVSYCTRQGIAKQTFYKWRHKLGLTSKCRQLQVVHKPSPFVSVAIKPVAQSSSDLPDPRWLANFAMELIRGLR